MASKLIAHLAAWYIPTGRTDLDGMEGLTVDCGYLLEAQRMHTELEARARGKPLMVEIEIKPVRDKRTLDQNRLMWVLLNKLALAMNGGTPGGVTAEQCYLDLLAEFGVEREIFEMPLRALPQFKRAYRVTHMLHTVIRYTVKVSEAKSAHEPLRVYKPDCSAALDYGCLADEVDEAVSKMDTHKEG